MEWVLEQQKQGNFNSQHLSFQNFKKVDIKTFDNLYEHLLTMISDNKVNWSANGQICINTVPGIKDSNDFGTGSLVLYNEEKDEWETLYYEKDFSVIRDCFKDTIFEDLYNEVKKHADIGRLRIMKMNEMRVLPWHYDYNTRFHYPIKTNPACMLVIENEALHIPQNEWWFTDTCKWHTAYNASSEERIHIVACILDASTSM